MARSRRTMPRGGGRRRKSRSADWVYRPNLRDEAGALIDDLGTYSDVLQTLLVGDATANAAILYDSHNRLMAASNYPGVANAPVVFPSAMRAEGERTKILAVEGVHFVRPSTWALGSEFRLAFRFGIFEQDANSGALLLDPLYGLWVEPGNMQTGMARWANDRMWQHERRVQEGFLENRTTFTYRFRFRVNRKLQPNQCYALFYSTSNAAPSSVTTVHRLFYRTLVAKGDM